MSKKPHIHRAVSPVIATLLMVAIAVVAGTMVFVFSQGYYSQAQISGTPNIEYIKIIGYDARDNDDLVAHDANIINNGNGGTSSNGKDAGERIAVYVKNDSVQQVSVSKLMVGGQIYNYTDNPGPINGVFPQQGTYSILSSSNFAITEENSVIKEGQTISFLIELDESFPIGRDTQFKLTTMEGHEFAGTVVMGNNLS